MRRFRQMEGGWLDCPMPYAPACLGQCQQLTHLASVIEANKLARQHPQPNLGSARHRKSLLRLATHVVSNPCLHGHHTNQNAPGLSSSSKITVVAPVLATADMISCTLPLPM